MDISSHMPGAFRRCCEYGTVSGNGTGVRYANDEEWAVQVLLRNMDETADLNGERDRLSDLLKGRMREE